MQLLFILTAFLGLSVAQRPNNISLCDYYAQSLYGTNTNVTQFRLIQSIITLAFGGPFTLQNVSSSLTGIWNPGTFQDLNVNLRPWFNGSIASTNLNNAPIQINWLDAGLQPLEDFLTGITPTVVLANTTNESRLFQHWFTAFGHIFGCSEPPVTPAPTSGQPTQQLSLAYVHKYMNLNYTDLGHFINQLSLACVHYGFSDQDAQTLATNLNSQYNVACAPPITLNPAQGPQLLSLCQASNCPLAEPSPDCAAYVDLQPGGLGNSTSPPSSTSSPKSSTSSTSSSSSSTTSTSSTSAAAQSSTSAAASANSTKLGGGAIAGIAIGATAVVLIAVGMLLFFFKKHKQPVVEPFTPSSAFVSPSYTDHHTSYTSNVEHWNGPTIAEMESPRYANNPAGLGNSPEMQQAHLGFPPHHNEI